ncbi:antibiotic biosynthesis monooxygenase family protein [Pseudomonas yamanorum]|uniref:Antibiotic biosynthesis monooxygenase n=1 Tax=Pseudomonas yamanorum TaxID=515393 RepID=A0A7Y8EGM2_9PSED|nr:antibiotic biosynthesis monooxygenase [Pseudomonas yamanorum]NWE14294.1 antibiotic biosynthesis monooxygenase [Pseudomonas yamanorum]
MYIAAFIYKPGERHDEFQRLTDLIDALAARLPGYVGAESWRSADGGLINASYYWRDEASIRAFASHPTHLEAKRLYRRWYGGYHVVISKVERAYGDGTIGHLVPADRHGHANA